jgi:hypothetical protein
MHALPEGVGLGKLVPRLNRKVQPMTRCRPASALDALPAELRPSGRPGTSQVDAYIYRGTVPRRQNDLAGSGQRARSIKGAHGTTRGPRTEAVCMLALKREANPPSAWQGFATATATAPEDSGLAGMSRRHVKSLPGWKQFFDHNSMSYYWLNTRNHSSQWNHPVENPRTRKQVEADWDGQKALVKLRRDKVGIVMGAADHWMPPHYAHTPADTPGPSSLQTKQKVLAMIHRWSLKWDNITESFRGMDINSNGEVSRSQLRTALIRFNVSYKDDLLEIVWTFLDPEDTGIVKIGKLTEFVFQNDPLKHKRTSAGSERTENEELGAQSEENIQRLNAAAERNQFARSMIQNMPRLQEELAKVLSESSYRTA